MRSPQFHPEAPPIIQGGAFVRQDRFATMRKPREVSEAKKLSLREVVVDQFERGPLAGTPEQVAQQIDDFVQNDGSDGFILGSHPMPTGLDEFVDDNLGLPDLRNADRVAADA
ncbi:hypothetical protein [Nocardia jiangsuensis]|uniref:Luciferase-like monooxygenase n=1 Tax=Nocardia jiangsuensis TaxID=1691563 RepID=A0ABV8DQQ5_9NOCA